MPSPAAESSVPDACHYDKFDVARDSGTTDSQTLGADQQVLRTVSKAPETVPIAGTLLGTHCSFSEPRGGTKA